MKIMISVGEASGDLHGASVAAALKELQPTAELFGMGGSAMAQAGVEILYDIAELGVMGLVEVLRNLPKLFRVRDLLKQAMQKRRPDVLVVIDYPGFNVRLAKIAKKLGIPVVFYISPSVWAWGAGRAKEVAEVASRVAAIFPFEAEAYRKAGAKVTFVGHPLLDIVKAEQSRAELRAAYGVGDQEEAILLLPGSRKQEIEKLLPSMLQAAEELQRRRGNCRFFLPVATTIPRAMIERQLQEHRLAVTLTDGRTYDLMKMADAAVAASGTVTLEAALLGLPCVVIYKMAAITYWLGKRLVRIPHISLPNIVAGRKVIPELLQEQVCGPVIAQEIGAMLEPENRQRLAQDMADVRRRLGEPGAVRRVAEEIVAVAEGR
ncbi:lipid-A-disaccharide synthase [Azotosporobacter soli]|uniref:lipid-A-disaccharide synthase n=1 Tax=Azotosporobacter soli TaxID=3055040 RepID=UPI0031FEA32A